MSFICQSCSNPQAIGVKPVKVVLQTRVKVYPVRSRGNVVIDNGGRGIEIAKEANMCKQCAAKQSVQRTLGVSLQTEKIKNEHGIHS